MYAEGVPYEVHLNKASRVACRFIHLIPETVREEVLAAVWMHDLIEDCRVNYNEIKEITNEPIAEMVFAVTNSKGRNRAERGDDLYYKGIYDTPYATFVKLCDRIANIEYSIETESRMVKMYRKEMAGFIGKLYKRDYYIMFEYLAKL